VTDEHEHDDVLDRIRRANPVPPGTTNGRRLAPDADALFTDIVRARPRPRRAVLIAVAIAIALLILAALAGFFLRREAVPTRPSEAACYPAVDLHPRRIVAVVVGDDARAACAEQWRLGNVGPGPPPHDFAVCLLPSGTQAVFPGEAGTTCARLGLKVAAPGRRAEAALSTDLARALGDKCYDEAGARALIGERLAAHDLSGWDVSLRSDSRFSDARPCASVFIDIPTRTILIVPIADPYVPVTTG
jgi:hypothetical protein